MSLIFESFAACPVHKVIKFLKFNSRYFKRKILIFVEFIPQIIFLSVLFLYLVVLIFLKWSLYSADACELRIIYINYVGRRWSKLLVMLIF